MVAQRKRFRVRARDARTAEWEAAPFLGPNRVEVNKKFPRVDMVMSGFQGWGVGAMYLRHAGNVTNSLEVPRDAYLMILVTKGYCTFLHEGGFVDVGEDALVLVSPDDEFQMCLCGMTTLKIVRIERHLMHASVQRRFGRRPKHQIRFLPGLMTNTGRLAGAHQALTQGVRGLGDPVRPPLFKDERLLKAAEEAFVMNMLDAVPFWIDAEEGSPERLLEHEDRLRGAVAFVRVLMEADPLDGATMTEYAREAGLSLPALNHAFLDYVGVLPHEMLRNLRLDGVRRFLQAARPWQTTVDIAARKFGFRNNMRFVDWYVRLFGETPEETLAGESDG
ncbi:AraC family transcriptional regulator [Amycolatopsis thermoflava]|uniref:AraC family transcriptional regulator n=1 Tax=Amycolatopsis thermoflava TaxID=84480 RepID=UPI003F4A0618